MKISNPRPTIERREFLRLLGLLGGAASVAMFLGACRDGESPPVSELESDPTATILRRTDPPTLSPSATAANSPSVPQETSTASPTPAAPVELPTGGAGVGKVVLVKTLDRAEGVRRAIDLLGSNPVSGKDVFLKPNFNSADPAPGSTHPDVLRALTLKLQEMGAVRITLGDRSGMGDTRQVMQALGVFDLAQELGFETLVLDELEASEWVRLNPAGSHWSQGFLFPKSCLDCGALVQTCCLKTHRYGGHFTLSLKNSVGMAAKQIPGENYNYMSELHRSPAQRLMIAEINAAYQPALVVLDGVEAFVDGGPDRGKRVQPGVILAGNDRVAIDAVGVAILRYFGTTPEVAQGPIFGLEQIARAVELGLGASGPDQIDLITDDRDGEAFAQELRRILDHS